MSIPEEIKTYCYNHPDRETYLRCNRCNRPICTSCAVLTPTGYRCKECIKGQQKVFDTARSYDPAIAFVIAALLAFGGSFVSGVMQFFTLFLAPMVGLLITEAIRWAVRRRRSVTMVRVAVIGAAIGSLPLLGLAVVTIFAHGFTVSMLLGVVWPAAYTFLVASTVYYRLSGIQA